MLETLRTPVTSNEVQTTTTTNSTGTVASSSALCLSPNTMLRSLLDELSFWEEPDCAHYTSKEIRKGMSSTGSVATASVCSKSSTSETSSKNNKNKSNKLMNYFSSSRENPPREVGAPSSCKWKTAVDPTTGRTYYYDAITRKTQWEKPAEIRKLEKKKKMDRQQKDLQFFRDMEQNLLQSLKRGEIIPGHASVPRCGAWKPQPSQSQSQPDQLPPPTHSQAQPQSQKIPTIQEDVEEDPIATAEAFSKSKTTNEASLFRQDQMKKERVRTLSTMDGDNQLLDQLRVDGSLPKPKPATTATNKPPRAAAVGKPPLPHAEQQKPALTPEKKQTTTSPPNSGGAGGGGHLRRNTGGTIYMRSTMANPDVEATMKCVCGVFRAHIVQSTQRKAKQSSVDHPSNDFEEYLQAFRDSSASPSSQKLRMPSLKDILSFYREFYQRSQMEHDTIIMSLIYVERLIKETNAVMTPSMDNWRSILFACLVLASKVWDDLSMWNIDFSNVSTACGCEATAFTLQRINQLELALLKLLNFDVKVPASEYAKYYFLIRTMLLRSGCLLEHDMKPLGSEDARKLEDRTCHYQDSVLKDQHGTIATTTRRSRTMDDWTWLSSSSEDPYTSASSGGIAIDKACLEQLVSMK